MRSMLFAALVAAWPIAWGVSTASAQSSTGRFAGTALDPCYTNTSATAIQIANLETGELVRWVESNEVGRFSVPLLRPGT